MAEPGRATVGLMGPQPDLTPDQWERIAMHLFGLLDDIDTASDLAKADDAGYRRIVEQTHPSRFRVAVTDGYRVVFRPLEPVPSTTSGGQEDTSDG